MFTVYCGCPYFKPAVSWVSFITSLMIHAVSNGISFKLTVTVSSNISELSSDRKKLLIILTAVKIRLNNTITLDINYSNAEIFQ